MRIGGTRKFQIAGFLLTLATAVGLPGLVRAQQAPAGQGYTIGILPFSDLSGNSQLGQLSSVLPGMMQNSLAQHSALVPRQIQPAMGAVPNAANAQAIDPASAAQLGQMNGTSVVLGGTLLNGEVSTKQGSFSGGHLGSLQLGGNTNHQSSTVTIQAVLIDATRGTSLGTFRATGQDTETHIDPNATTNYGSMNMQSSDFQNTPLAKAAQKAVDDLTRQIVAALKGFSPTAVTAGDHRHSLRRSDKAPRRNRCRLPCPRNRRSLSSETKICSGRNLPTAWIPQPAPNSKISCQDKSPTPPIPTRTPPGFSQAWAISVASPTTRAPINCT